MSTKAKIYLIQSFNNISNAVLNIILSASNKADADMLVFSDNNRKESYKIFTSEAISQATLVIADVSSSDPNVMMELGYAQAQQKPIILVADSSRDVPANLFGFRTFIYDLNRIDESIKALAYAISNCLINPKDYIYSEVVKATEKRKKVFISYSHKDREYLDRLLVHLKPLERDGLIEVWDDTKIQPGDKWKSKIEESLQRSTVAILLVSADFLASDFIVNNELPPLLKKAEEEGARIIPVIVMPCGFTRDKNLSQFQALNEPSNPLVLQSYGEREIIYDKLSALIGQSLQHS